MPTGPPRSHRLIRAVAAGALVLAGVLVGRATAPNHEHLRALDAPPVSDTPDAPTDRDAPGTDDVARAPSDGWRVDLDDSIVVPIADGLQLGPDDAAATVVLFADPALAASRALIARASALDDTRVVLHPVAQGADDFAGRAVLAAARRGEVARVLATLDARGGDLDDVTVRDALTGAGLDDVVADAFGSTLDARLAATEAVAVSVSVRELPTAFVGPARLSGAALSDGTLEARLDAARARGLAWSSDVAAGLRPVPVEPTFRTTPDRVVAPVRAP